jgi:hypothetical protein
MTFHYADPDNPWEDEDKAWRFTDDIPLEYRARVEEAMDICRRTSHTFRKPSEFRKWLTIVGRLEKGTIPMKWFEHCLKFADSKNRVAARAIPISFETLTRYIMNKAAMTDWLGKNPDFDWVPGTNDPYE